MPKTARVIAKQHLRMLLDRPDVFLPMLLLPVIITGLMSPLLEPILVRHGYLHAAGADYVIPGMAILFSFVLVSDMAFTFLQEYEWKTWPRLVASPASGADILVGKAVPALVLLLLQGAALFLLGHALFGFEVRGSIGSLMVVEAAIAACALGFGLFLVGVSSNARQVNLFANLGALVLVGIGGALVPLTELPGWVRAIAPITPSYWAIRALRGVVLDGHGLAAVAASVFVLLLFAIAFAVAGIFAFRLDDSRTG